MVIKISPGGQACRWRAVNCEIHLWSSGKNADCIFGDRSASSMSKWRPAWTLTPEMIPFPTKSVTLSMLIDLLTSTMSCRSTQVKIASTDLWPQKMFTFSEMLALVESESSFGAYVCHRRPGGSRATSDLVKVCRTGWHAECQGTLSQCIRFTSLNVSVSELRSVFRLQISQRRLVGLVAWIFHANCEACIHRAHNYFRLSYYNWDSMLIPESNISPQHYLVGFANSDAFPHTQKLASIQTATNLPSSTQLSTPARREQFSNQMRTLSFNAMEIHSTQIQSWNCL